MNAEIKFRIYEFLLATYLFTGSGLMIHGSYTMNAENVLFGTLLFVLAMAVFAAMVVETENRHRGAK